MYYTMLAILEGVVAETASAVTETMLMAGSIAVALLVVASVIKLLAMIGRRLLAHLK
jgi:uncharacterized membrane protein YjjB (DUF3815 family)